jgi:SAM-dependent methyltransferase
MDLLDVGCGPGSITADLAQAVAPGRVVALDSSAEVLALARAELERRGLGSVELVTGDVAALDLPDASVDVAHAHQLLHHVPDPVAAVAEMLRVTRPGGLVAIRESDYGAFTWYPSDPRLDRWRELFLLASRANGGEPEAGRRLLAWVHAAGATAVTASSSTWCYADPRARQGWGGMWAERIQHSAIADQLLAMGAASRAELADLGDAWLDWAAHPDGWISILQGEVLIGV